jgi:cellulose synthase/poly-beta-1,6-N-acetylglucosamine synthase-like glycosyltransferase
MEHLPMKPVLDAIGLLFVLGTLPLLLELFVLTIASVVPRRRPASTKAAVHALPKLAVIIPCHNEELHISRCLESLLFSSSEGTDVLVVVHNCTDKTLERVASFPSVKIAILNDKDQRGKGFALQEGFRLVFETGTYDAAVIVDADSVVSPNFLTVVKESLSRCDLVQCLYEVNNPMSNWRTSVLALAMQAMNVVRPRGRDRLSLSCGIFGNGFALRKSVLARVPYNSYSIVEDLEFHLSLVERGYRVRFIDHAKVSADMPTESSAAATQRARWEGGRLRILRTSGGKILRSALAGRLEFIEPLLDLLSMPLAFAIIILALLFVIPGTAFHVYAVIAYLVILCHLYIAARAGPDFTGSMRALLFAPLYILWKMTMLSPIIRASQNGAEWVRTRRGITRQ